MPCCSADVGLTFNDLGIGRGGNSSAELGRERLVVFVPFSTGLACERSPVIGRLAGGCESDDEAVPGGPGISEEEGLTAYALFTAARCVSLRKCAGIEVRSLLSNAEAMTPPGAFWGAGRELIDEKCLSVPAVAF